MRTGEPVGTGATDGFDPGRAAEALIAKTPSHAGGRRDRVSLLLTHCLDTAAVADILWDVFVTASAQQNLDAAAGGDGRGRALFRWICALHDLGKASPAFQARFPRHTRTVLAAGLTYDTAFTEKRGWRHERIGAYLLRELLTEAGWPRAQTAWVWPLVAGHHGHLTDANSLRAVIARSRLLGGPLWHATRHALVQRVSEAVGFADGAVPVPVRVPSRPLQLQLSGLLKLADWISSGLDGIDDPRQVSMEHSRTRAREAWRRTGVHDRDWSVLSERSPETAGEDRAVLCVTTPPGLLTATAERLARRSDGPGLLIVEASAGSGLRSGLRAAEILAARTGARGVFVAVPELFPGHRAFHQVREWATAVDPAPLGGVTLLHDLRALAQTPPARVSPTTLEERLSQVAECPGEPDGADVEARSGLPDEALPVDWFHGHEYGLLAPVAVGPLHELLAAATRTRHVMVRMAGLLGKVVVLDRAHATDARTGRLLLEALRWFGQGGVPVVLTAPVLSGHQRRHFLEAYLGGAASQEEYTVDGPLRPPFHPSVTAAWRGPDGDRVEALPAYADEQPGARATGAGNPPGHPHGSVRVTVEPLPGTGGGPGVRPEDALSAGDPPDDAAVADRLAAELRPGGVALVVRDTTSRVQTLGPLLRRRLGPGYEVVALDNGLAAGTLDTRVAGIRSRTTRGAVAPDPSGGRGAARGLVVVTERAVGHGLDLAADLVVTDLMPMELLTEAIAPLHREPAGEAPDRPRAPRVIVTGFGTAGWDGTTAPRFPTAAEQAHGRYPLLLAAALVLDAARGPGWSLPRDLPALVEHSTGLGRVPRGWGDVVEAARLEWLGERRRRSGLADGTLLTRSGGWAHPTLAGLHDRALPHSWDQRDVLVHGDAPVYAAALVRDTDGYRTLCGRPLGRDALPQDDRDAVVEDIVRGVVRLPPECAGADLERPRAWGCRKHGDIRLRRLRVLPLDTSLRTVLAGRHLRYDQGTGLLDEGPAH